MAKIAADHVPTSARFMVNVISIPLNVLVDLDLAWKIVRPLALISVQDKVLATLKLKLALVIPVSEALIAVRCL